MERGRGEEIPTVGVLTLVPSKVRMRKAREVKNVKSKKKFDVTVEHNVDVVIFYQTRKGFCLSHARAHFDRHCMLCFNSINRSNLWNWTRKDWHVASLLPIKLKFYSFATRQYLEEWTLHPAVPKGISQHLSRMNLTTLLSAYPMFLDHATYHMLTRLKGHLFDLIQMCFLIVGILVNTFCTSEARRTIKCFPRFILSSSSFIIPVIELCLQSCCKSNRAMLFLYSHCSFQWSPFPAPDRLARDYLAWPEIFGHGFCGVQNCLGEILGLTVATYN